MTNLTKIFTYKEQNLFADISGDYNKIHLDKKVASRSIFGYPIVHGIHLVLWALEKEYSISPFKKIENLKAIFKHSVYIDEIVSFQRKQIDENIEINLISRERIVTTIILNVKKKDTSKINIKIKSSSPPVEEPLEMNIESMENYQGTLDLFLNNSKLKDLLPLITNRLPDYQIATIISTSKLVGNIIPGKNSLFTNLILKSKNSCKKNKLSFNVSKIDKRFRFFIIKVQGPSFEGEIEAFERPFKINQNRYEYFQEIIPTYKYKNINALIIGGSRGLGEVTTKILCAGGANVIFTYFNGKEESEKIVKEIENNGGKVKNIYLDINQNIEVDLPKINLLVYMPTPFIFEGVKSKFSPVIFKKFIDYYVFGLIKICNKLNVDDQIIVFNPSTVAIDELPLNMGEYSVAKAASEIMSSFLDKANKNFKFHCPRLSRLKTDQTNSIRPIKNEDPVPVIFRELNIIKGLMH
tara:strand:- start:490 stop:1890 length:1401 start_codon:yes stop_codon:yes gene_type:complete